MADTLPPPPKGGQKSWPKHPAGPTQLVLVDVINLGHRVKDWQGVKKVQPRIALVWQSAKFEPRVDGKEVAPKRYELAREFTYSTFQNARLRPFLESWRGAQFKSEAEAEAELQALPKWVGKNGLGSIVHETRGDKTYCNVDTIMPPLDGMTPLTVHPYTRAPFWLTKKEQYAKDVMLYEQERLAKSTKEAETLADFPAALAADDGDDDLPF